MHDNLSDLNDNELMERLTTVQEKMRYMRRSAASANYTSVLQQCELWCMEIELELQERHADSDLGEPGVVATIGEEVFVPKEEKIDPNRKWLNRKGRNNG